MDSHAATSAAAPPAGAPRPGASGPTQAPLAGGFGSFYSGDVEALIRLPRDQYRPPPRPFPLPHAICGPGAAAALAARPFGASFRRDFLVEFDSWTFINHGAFGGVLAATADDAEAWRRHCERQPLRHIDRSGGRGAPPGGGRVGMWGCRNGAPVSILPRPSPLGLE
jgi:hypothetical protein